jgi:hypothetical protein
LRYVREAREELFARVKGVQADEVEGSTRVKLLKQELPP